MTKLIIPVIIAVTILAGGIFALTPVERATAVHTTIQGTQMTQAILDSTAGIGGADIVCDSDAAFAVFVIIGNAETDNDNITVGDSVNTLTMSGDLTANTDGVAGFGTGYSTTIAADAASTIRIGGSAGSDDALVSLITTSGALADCTDGL